MTASDEPFWSPGQPCPYCQEPVPGYTADEVGTTLEPCGHVIAPGRVRAPVAGLDLRAELLAEIERQEKIARRAEAGLADLESIDLRARKGGSIAGLATFLSDFPPATVLRQLAGVRAVVEMHERDPGIVSNDEGFCRLCLVEGPDVSALQEPYPCPTVRALHAAFCGSGDGK